MERMDMKRGRVVDSEFRICPLGPYSLLRDIGLSIPVSIAFVTQKSFIPHFLSQRSFQTAPDIHMNKPHGIWNALSNSHNAQDPYSFQGIIGFIYVYFVMFFFIRCLRCTLILLSSHDQSPVWQNE
jgi:hypothetical protein